MSVDNFIAVLANEGCGEHLEYDAEFLELFNQVTVREESQYGDYVFVPEPIDCKVLIHYFRGLCRWSTAAER